MKVLKSRGFAIVLIAAGALLLIFSVWGLTSSSGGDKDKGETEDAALWEVEPEQTPPGAEDAGEAEDVAYISIPGFESATIAADSETVELYLYNPEANDCWFVISIWLEDGGDGEEIYESKLIAPGQELFEITLSRPLEAGTYEARLHYDTYTTDGNYTPLNGANVPFTLIAE